MPLLIKGQLPSCGVIKTKYNSKIGDGISSSIVEQGLRWRELETAYLRGSSPESILVEQ